MGVTEIENHSDTLPAFGVLPCTVVARAALMCMVHSPGWGFPDCFVPMPGPFFSASWHSPLARCLASSKSNLRLPLIGLALLFHLGSISQPC